MICVFYRIGIVVSVPLASLVGVWRFIYGRRGDSLAVLRIHVKKKGLIALTLVVAGLVGWSRWPAHP